MAGAGKAKTGGRKKGTPNKASADLLQQIRDHIGDQDFHPVLAMAEMATAMETVTEKGKKITRHVYPLSTREAMTREVARYVSPQLKAIEHTGDAEGFGLNLHMNLGPAKKGNGRTR